MVDHIQTRVADSIAAIGDIVDQVAKLDAGQRRPPSTGWSSTQPT